MHVEFKNEGPCYRKEAVMERCPAQSCAKHAAGKASLSNTHSVVLLNLLYLFRNMNHAIGQVSPVVLTDALAALALRGVSIPARHQNSVTNCVTSAKSNHRKSSNVQSNRHLKPLPLCHPTVLGPKLLRIGSHTEIWSSSQAWR